MAITYIGSVSNPADNAADAGPDGTLDFTGASILPQIGDAVLIVGNYRGDGSAGPENGPWTAPSGATQLQAGQYWNSHKPILSGTTVSGRLLWTQVGRLTGVGWGANPTFGIPSGTAPLTLTAHVFRPTSPDKFIIVDIGPVPSTYTATGTTKTLTAYSTVEASTVTVAAWLTAAATTWSGLSGSGWSVLGSSNQYRNTSGSLNSIALAYNIQSSAGALANVSNTQGTGTAGAGVLITLAEIDLPTPGTGTQSFTRSVEDSDAVSGATISAVFGSGVASGSGVVGFFSHETTANGYVASNGIADNQSNRYYPVSYVNDPKLDQQNIIFYRPNITNAPTTVTVTLNVGEIARTLILHEVANLAGFQRATGYHHQTTDIFSADLVQTGYVTPPASGAYCGGFIASDLASDADWHTAGSGWTERQISLYAGDGNNHVTSFDRVCVDTAAIRLEVTEQTGAFGPISFAVFGDEAPPAPRILFPVQSVRF